MKAGHIDAMKNSPRYILFKGCLRGLYASCSICIRFVIGIQR